MEGDLGFIDTDIQDKLRQLRQALIDVDDEPEGPSRDKSLNDCDSLAKECKSLFKSFKLEAANAGLPTSKTAPHNKALKKYQGELRKFEQDLGRAKMGKGRELMRTLSQLMSLAAATTCRHEALRWSRHSDSREAEHNQHE